jgi:hypothetical protein
MELKSIIDGTNKQKDAKWETIKAIKLVNQKLDFRNKVTLKEVRENLIADCDVEDIKNGLYSTEHLAYVIQCWIESGKYSCINNRCI